MADQSAASLFKQSSTTYFFSSLFFPEPVRSEVTTLYGFVRVADNFVDAIPQESKQFYAFKDQYTQALAGKSAHNAIIDNFVELSNKHSFELSWVEAFFKSMELDLYKSRYDSIDQTCSYMYGSAEVIGMMLAKILQFPAASFEYARMLGRSMQYCNMIRDVAEDCQLRRQYIPTEVLKSFELSELSQNEAEKHPDKFSAMIQSEIRRYYQWESLARRGYSFMPKRFKVPIATATDMYHWTMEQIEHEPMIVWQRKVKPHRLRVVKMGLDYLTEFYPYDN